MRQLRQLLEPEEAPILLLPAVHSARGNLTQALSDLREIASRAEPFPFTSTVAHLAEHTVLTSAPLAEQQAACERAVSFAERAGARKPFAIALRARGRMHMEQENWVLAEQDLARALEKMRELDLPWEIGETLYCQGLLHQRRIQQIGLEKDASAYASDWELASFFFRQAIDFFASLNAVPDVLRVRDALRQLGSPVSL